MIRSTRERLMRTPIDLLYLPAYTTRSANRRADLRVYSGRKTKCTLGTTTVVALLCALLSQLGGETRAAVAPIISSIPDQVTTEDEPILRVPFTVSDADSPLALLS